MIYVTVGTMYMDFARLIHKMDDIARDTGERVVIQTGLAETVAEHCETFAFKPRDEVLELQREARVIVCHAGVGSILDALEARKPFVVVPRRKGLGEHVNDHQLDIAHAVERRGWCRTVLDIDDLEGACADPTPAPADYRPAKHRLIGALREFIDRVAARKGGAVS